MLFVLFFVYLFWRRKQCNREWEALGERLDFTYKPPPLIGSYRKLKGSYKGRPVVIEVILYGSGNDKESYTKYGRRLDKRWSDEVEIAPFKKKLLKRKPDGYRTGDPSFDEKYEVFGKITEEVEAVILQADVRRELERLSGHYASFWTEGGWLWVEHKNVANNAQRMQKTLDRMMGLDQAITAALDAHGGEDREEAVEEAPSGGVAW